MSTKSNTYRVRPGLMAGILALLLVFFIAVPQEAQAANLRNQVKVIQDELELLRTTLDSVLEDLQALREGMKTQISQGAKTEAGVSEQTKQIESLENKVSKLRKVLLKKSKHLKLLKKRIKKLEKKPEGRNDLNPSVTTTADVRARGEMRNNHSDFSSDTSDRQTGYNQRLRFGLVYKATDKVSAHITAQDARAFGSELSTSADDGELGLYEGYVSLAPPMVKGLTLDIGRMGFSYGSGMLIGIDDWSNTGRAFDGMRINYVHDMFNLDLFYSMVQERVATSDPDVDLGGLVLGTSKIGPWFKPELQIYYLNNGSTGPTGKQLTTLSFRATGTPVKGLEYDAEAAIQIGTVRNLTGEAKDRFATAYHVHVQYGVEHEVKPKFHFDIYAASGDGNPTDDRDVNFDPLFPDTYYHLDPMGILRLSNLVLASLRAELKPVSYMSVQLGFHSAFLASTRGGIPGIGPQYPVDEYDSRSIGNELHLSTTYQRGEFLEIRAGYAIFMPGDAVKDAVTPPNSTEFTTSPAHWAYVQSHVKF